MMFSPVTTFQESLQLFSTGSREQIGQIHDRVVKILGPQDPTSIAFKTLFETVQGKTTPKPTTIEPFFRKLFLSEKMTNGYLHLALVILREQYQKVLPPFKNEMHFLHQKNLEDDPEFDLFIILNNLAADSIKASTPISPEKMVAFLRIVAESLGIPEAHKNESELFSALKKMLWNNFLNGNDTLLSFTAKKTLNESIDLTILPEALALCLGDLELMTSIMIAKQNVNDTDCQGYTVSHFAALLSNRNALIILYHLKADFDITTTSGNTVFNLLAVQGHSLKINKNAPLYSPESLFLFWLNKLNLYLYPSPTKAVQTFITEPSFTPPVNKKDDRLYAARKIKPGELIIEFVSKVEALELFDQSLKGDIRKMRAGEPNVIFDANSHSNDASVIGHGPPIAATETVILHGLPHLIVYALTTIEKGCEITIDAGKRAVGFFPEYRNYESPNQELLDDFILRQTKNFSQFLQNLKHVPNQKNHILVTYQFKEGGVSPNFLVCAELTPSAIEKLQLEILFQKMMTYHLFEFPERILYHIREGNVSKNVAIQAFVQCTGDSSEEYKKLLEKISQAT